MTPQHPFADLALFANNPPWVETAVAAGLLLAVATIANLVVKLLIVRLIVRLMPFEMGKTAHSGVLGEYLPLGEGRPRASPSARQGKDGFACRAAR